ncbi:MAG: hypothetical protein M3R69_16770 [Acidobacteriota bacterium]|nr:hypothetical protein [Acidobacteriota bacterium]
MKKSLLFFVVVTLLSAFAQVFGQTPSATPAGPPKVVLIVREEIKPGMMPAHNKHSASYASLFRKLQTPNYRIALLPVAGSENEVIYLNPLESFAQLQGTTEATDKKMEGLTGSMKAESDRLTKEAPELHAGMRDMLGVLRPELGYGGPVDISKMRFFSVTTVRVRPGHDAQYNDYVQKVLNVARQKAKVDNLHLASFQIISGAPAGTYMFFRPMGSLAEMDVPTAMRVRAAMSDDTKKDADKAASDAIISSENSTYWINPNMSYVPPPMAAGDPAFWNPKPEPIAVKPKPKPRPRKPATPPPPPTE